MSSLTQTDLDNLELIFNGIAKAWAFKNYGAYTRQNQHSYFLYLGLVDGNQNYGDIGNIVKHGDLDFNNHLHLQYGDNFDNDGKLIIAAKNMSLIEKKEIGTVIQKFNGNHLCITTSLLYYYNKYITEYDDNDIFNGFATSIYEKSGYSEFNNYYNNSHNYSINKNNFINNILNINLVNNQFHYNPEPCHYSQQRINHTGSLRTFSSNTFLSENQQKIKDIYDLANLPYNPTHTYTTGSDVREIDKNGTVLRGKSIKYPKGSKLIRSGSKPHLEYIKNSAKQSGKSGKSGKSSIARIVPKPGLVAGKAITASVAGKNPLSSSIRRIIFSTPAMGGGSRKLSKHTKKNKKHNSKKTLTKKYSKKQSKKQNKKYGKTLQNINKTNKSKTNKSKK